MGIDRFITLIKPALNTVAAALAALIVAKANALGIEGIDNDGTTQLLVAAGVWILTQGALQLGDLKWVKGRHIMLAGDAQVQAAAMTPAAASMLHPAPIGLDLEHEALMELDNDLPDDDEEFAAPPPGDDNFHEDIETAEARRPIQPSEEDAL